MALFLVCGGRALFFALLVTQNFMLAAYPATYKDDSTWYAVHAMASSLGRLRMLRGTGSGERGTEV